MDAKAEKIALFRFGVIASLVLGPLPRGAGAIVPWRAHPRRPKAITCCLFSSFKTLLTLTEGTALASDSTSRVMAYRWPVFR